jgi:hypothetical protein
MISLLPDEKPIADLRLGLVQIISEDIFRRRTMVLTNRRLWLIEKRIFSNSASILFLRDITTVETKRTVNLIHCIGAALFSLWGLASLAYVPFGASKDLGIEGAFAIGICWGLPLLAFGVNSSTM